MSQDGRSRSAYLYKSITAELEAQHQRPEYQCRFSWQEGSIAFWDNRAVQHYAVSDYHPHRRILRRVTISGDRPYRDRTGEPTPGDHAVVA